MPPLLRSRIKCFYCGGRSDHTKSDKIRKFECRECDATNYLDENGEIVDVPPSATPTHVTFAQSRPRGASPTARLSSSDSLFCALCLKNQQFLTNCLATYLPAEDDPRYHEFETGYPEYRAQLEKRYPPVCPQCEPNVRAKLRKSAYAAKTDILTRSLSRPQQHSRNALGFLSVVAGFMWWLSNVVQWTWHVFGAIGMLDYTRTHTLWSDSWDFRSTPSCLLRGALNSGFDPQCSELLRLWVFLAVMSRFLLMWWNPSFGQKEKFRNGYVGLHDYYILQILVWIIAGYSWRYLKLNEVEYSKAKLQGSHAFMFIFLTMYMIVAPRLVRPALPPKPTFRNIDAPLVDKDSFHYPADTFASQPSSRALASVLQSHSTARQFPIKHLAPRGANDTPSPSTSRFLRKPRTPPPDTESELDAQSVDDMAMDWEPIRPHEQPLFAPVQRKPLSTLHAPPAPQGFAPNGQAVKSPFYGQLPPAPKSMEHRLRSKAQQPAPAFRPAPAEKQRDWFRSMGLRNPAGMSGNKQVSTGSETSDQYVKSLPDSDRDKYNLAESKWMLRSDLDAATRGTGLEDLFTTNFKIEDELGSQAHPTNGVEAPQATDGSLPARIATFLFISALCVAAVVLTDSARKGHLSQSLQDFAETFQVYQ